MSAAVPRPTTSRGASVGGRRYDALSDGLSGSPQVGLFAQFRQPLIAAGRSHPQTDKIARSGGVVKQMLATSDHRLNFSRARWAADWQQEQTTCQTRWRRRNGGLAAQTGADGALFQGCRNTYAYVDGATFGGCRRVACSSPRRGSQPIRGLPGARANPYGIAAYLDNRLDGRSWGTVGLTVFLA
jgi:hypothetical protein